MELHAPAYLINDRGIEGNFRRATLGYIGGLINNTLQQTIYRRMTRQQNCDADDIIDRSHRIGGGGINLSEQPVNIGLKIVPVEIVNLAPARKQRQIAKTDGLIVLAITQRPIETDFRQN